MSRPPAATAPAGRRERKKAATRRHIAEVALKLFTEFGYDAVGVRRIADDADVAVTTLFSHFPSKEDLVFEQTDMFALRLKETVRDGDRQTTVLQRIRKVFRALLLHCTSDDTVDLRTMIEESTALSSHAQVVELRFSDTLAKALIEAHSTDSSPTALQMVARCTVDAFSIARRSPTPMDTFDELFRMVEATGQAAGLESSQSETPGTA
ncbi:TetR/AcrR family transcriptional regulator [Corynebacterium nuruki]|uniref:TetR/AcrR family transcriptional regulator n=1 Tax=Corynebacterium nuruki TaxID=1032851 RepID=UPI0039BFFDAB